MISSDVWLWHVAAQQRNVSLWVGCDNCRVRFTRLVFPLGFEPISQVLCHHTFLPILALLL